MRKWHKILQLPKYERQWYRDRLKEELKERRQANSFISRLSETSDVYYILQRGHYDNFTLKKLKYKEISYIAVVYMIFKYSLRWTFYRTSGILARASHPIREVINPKKDKKLQEIAKRSSVEEERFIKVAKSLRRVWPFLP